MADAIVDANYRWWQEHGGGWPGEVAQRKGHMPIYSIQEVFLAEYLSRHAPARVLEFGCGFGRHLAYLSRIPGLTLAGCDQSLSMVEDVRSWATVELIAEHVRVTSPLAPLPYPDKTFDIVFTVSVLIHIRPEHVADRLTELTRVCRGQILHIENNVCPESVLTAEAHDGCWAHPFVQHYDRLGYHVEVLPKPFEIQDVYRIVVDPEHRIVDLSPVTLGNLLKLDRATTEHIGALRQEIAAARTALEQANRSIGELEAAFRVRHEEHIRDMQQLWAASARLQ